MRKYRGLTKDGEWVYGWYIKMPNQKLDVKDLGDGALSCEKKNADSFNSCIAYLPEHGTGLAFSIVIPETVGQQIGRKDKNGQEIYEGDIVKIGYGKYVCEYRVTEWSGEFRFMVLPHKKWFDGSSEPKEIIGNIFQNKDLLNETYNKNTK